MKNTQKILSFRQVTLRCIGCLISVIVFWSTGFAQSVPHNDCSLVQAYLSHSKEIGGGLADVVEGLTYIQDLDRNGYYPASAVTQAMTNLQAYCCFSRQIPDFFCENTTTLESIVPTSPYLFDHLVDIAMRRLDGDEDEIYGNISILDEKGKERREHIREDATDIDGKPPAMIYDSFNQARGPIVDKYNHVADARDHDEVCNVFAVYADTGTYLRGKYMNQCNISLCLYRKMAQSHFNYAITDIGYTLEQGYRNCQNMVQNRVLSELKYVQATMVHQGNQFLWKSLSKVTHDYFVGSRLSRLLTKLTKQLTWFEIINRKVVQGTRECSF